MPLPSSLTQLFEGGGVVAGGGAAAGTGLVLKAAVAIVAAALGTGIGGDRSRRALLRRIRARALFPHSRSKGAVRTR